MWWLWSVERKRSAVLLQTYTTINVSIAFCRKKRCTSLLHTYTIMKMCIVVCTKQTVQTTPTSLHYNKCGHCGLYKGNCVQHYYTPTLQQMSALWSVESKRSAALLHTYTITNVVILICGKVTVCSTPTYLHYNKNVHRGMYKGNSADHSYIPTLQ